MQSSLGVKTLLQDPTYTSAARVRSSSATEARKPPSKPRPLSAPTRPIWHNPNALPARPLKKYTISLHHTSQDSRVTNSAPYATRKTLGTPTRAQATGGRPYLLEPYNPLSDPHLAHYYSRRFETASRTKLFKSPQKTRKRKISGVVYKLVVRTDSRKTSGTDANVFVELKGSKGLIGKTRLFHKPDGVKSSSYLYEPPFAFGPGSEEIFTIRGPDIGDIKVLNVEHDGLDRKQGWFLVEILVKNTRNKKVWTFPCFQWLSLFESDCQIKRQLKPNRGTQPAVKTVYEIMVETGDIRGAGTDAKVYMTLFGSKGQTPKVMLSNRDHNNFERGKTDRFKIKSTQLGALKKMIVEHDNTGFGPGWFLDKVTVTELVKGNVMYFPCGQWLDKDEGDGQIRRQLMATKRATDQYKGFKYKVCTYTGNVRGAGTDASVTITIFGEQGDTGEHCLDNSRNNFEKGRMDTFRVESINLGELIKLRIGHDNRGAAPGWFLDKVTVEDESRGKVFEFPCHRWFAKDEDDRQITRELTCVNGSPAADMYIAPGVPYQLHVTTGDVRNASTSAKVFVVLHGGDNGEKNSGRLVLRNNSDNFERGRTDIFHIETADCLSPLHHLTIGHDNSGLGAGWYCEKIEVDCPSTGCKQVFLCQQWIADDEGDGRLERDLFELEDMRQKRRPKIVYNVWVWTSDERGAGTDANVFFTLYGKKGKTDEIQIGNATDNFEQGQLDKFKVELANVGPLYKLRVRHDNSKPFSDWHLEKIQVENAKTGSKYSFKCGRWLSLKEDDKSLIRELPALGEGIEPQPVLIYQVSVHTAKKTGAGTDANVFLNIFGEQGDTGERPLMFSKNNRNKFEKGNVDQFDVEAVKLGKLKKIRIGHDGSGPGAGWFLDKVVITDSTEPTKEYNFPCERWLAKDEDDGQIIRELSLGGTSLLQTTSYKVTVRTGDERGAGTDANVYIQIFGKNGDTGRLPLRQSENTKNKFERGRADMFTVEAVDIGKLEMVRVGHDGKGLGAGWYLDEVTVEVPSHGQLIVFPCHRWLAEDEDDGRIERELYPGQQNTVEQKIPYEVVVHTGDVRGAGTDANVILVLYGQKGKSDEFQLRNKTDNFERAKVDKFKVESEDIGPLTKIRIGHDNSGFGAAWFLDKIEISRIKPDDEKPKKKKRSKKRKTFDREEEEDENDDDSEENDYEYLFLCNRWLAKNEGDGEIMRELVPSTKSGLKRRNTLSENTYVMHVYTGDVMHAGTNANVLVTIFGENGDSGERKLSKSEKHIDKFERNQEDVFTIKCISLGHLSKLKIRHDNTGMKSAWFLHKVEIEDKLKNQRYVFPCDRWLATDEEDGQISRELPALTLEDFNAEHKRKMTRRQSSKALVDSLDLEAKARLSSYEISVTTGDVSGAGTDANVYIILYGEKGETGKLDLKTSKTNKDKFERNQTDVFSMDADVGTLKKIRIGHDNKGGFAGWFLDKVEIDSRSLGKKWLFPCGRWLDKSKDDGLLERDLYAVEGAEEEYTPHVPYEITVHTGNVSGAGTSANVFIVIYGADSNTGECVLAETKKKKKNCFDRGAIDQFVKELVDVGDVIEKIRIGHDGKGIGAGWFLDKVEIRRLLDDNKSATLYTFPCRRWLAKGEDDGAIVRELVPKDVTEEIVDKHGEVVSNKVDHQALDVRKYRVHVFTGDVKGAGTDANVFVTLFGQYGDSGERQLSKSETHTDKFERGKEDIFTFEAADLGYMHKLKLRHDNAMMNPAWFVDRVEVEDMATDRKFVFHCERWLAKNKEDKKIERTLYEKEYKGDRSSIMTGLSVDSVLTTKSRSSGGTGNLGATPTKNRSADADAIFDKEFKKDKKYDEPLKTISYTVRVATGDQRDAGTEAKAYVVLIGSHAVTEKIDLELVQKPGFEPGTAETFSVDAVDVGEVKKIEIGHHGYTQQDGWYLKEVEIDVPTRGKVYHFPCNRWLAKDKEDGHTLRILSVNENEQVSYKPHVPYEITIFTGDVKDAGTDSEITMTLYGSQGATPEISLEKGDEKFERGAVDMFRMELDDVGKLRKLRIGHDGKGNRPSWYLDKVIIRNDETGSVSVFKCNDWLSKTMGERQLVKELPAITDGEKTLGNTTYKVSVITGDVTGAGTDANVFLIIFGENGDSGEIPLKNSETYKDKFERGHTDVFIVKDILSLGELTKVRVWHDNKFLKASWFLERTDVEDESSKKVYKFPCDRWLGKDKDDGSLLRELPCANRDESIDSPVAVFEITLLTSDKQKAGTNQNASVMLIGEKRKSQVYYIENSPKKKVLRRGQTDTFKFVTKPLGPVQEVIVGHHPKPGQSPKNSEKESSWYLHEVIVKNTDNSEKFVFPCRQWIPQTANKKDGVRLECKSSERSRLATIRELKPVQYEVAVFTADVVHAGTDANVSIIIYGDNGDTGQRKLTKKMVNLFERGQRDVFTLEALDLGQLKKLRIEHDNKGFGAGWKLDKVEVTNLNSSEMVQFPCNQWLDKKKGDGLVCRDLVPTAAN